MPITDMLIDSAFGYEILSFLDGYSGYNQIYIAEEDVSKTAFRCPSAIGIYEWVVMGFGLKKKRFSGNVYALIDVNSSLQIASINGKHLKQYRPTIHEMRI